MPFYFDHLNGRIRSALKSAEKSILICVAWIDFDIYAKVLEEKLNKGVSVKVIATKNKRYSNNDDLQHLISIGMEFEEINVGMFNYMHNKIAIIDDKLVITGSFNWTHNAEHSFENILIERIDKEDFLILKHEIESISRRNSLKKEMRRRKKQCPKCRAKSNYCIFVDNDNATWLVETCKNCHVIKKQHIFADSDVSIINYIDNVWDKYQEYLEYLQKYDKKEYSYLCTKIKIEVNEMIEDFVWSSSFPILAIISKKCSLDQKGNEDFFYDTIWMDRFETFDIDCEEIVDAIED